MLNEHSLPPLSGGKPRHAVILVHGLGDSGAGLIGLGEVWRQALPDTEFLAPDAPFPCDMAPFGYQWFSLQNRSPAAMLANVREASPILDAYIDEVQASRALPAGRVALVGFSQGTMLSLYAALRRQTALAGVVGYSGTLVGGEALSHELTSSPPVLLVHGMLDEVVPFPAMAQAERGLRQAGVQVVTHACPNLGHSIDDAGLDIGLAFLRDAFQWESVA